MKIHILCTDGSPIGVTLKDLWGDGNRGIGLGGSEYALLTMCEEWHKEGHEVVLYNSPMTPGGSPFEQRLIHTYNPTESRDILIVFRSPNIRSVQTSNCLKVWWSCDQYTIGNFQEFSKTVNKIVCISNFHADYFSLVYGIRNAVVIDLPVRTQDLIDVGEVKKVPNKLLFTSVPDRGLGVLRGMWPIIRAECPEATLTITSDYRLWGCEERNQHHKIQWLGLDGVRFLGAVKRNQLIVEQLESQILAYPCTYEELFCISAAEAQCAGAYPITSKVGALTTTNMGKLIEGNPRGDVRLSGNFRGDFTNEVIRLLRNPVELEEVQQKTKELAMLRFNPKNIVRQWNEKVFNGG